MSAQERSWGEEEQQAGGWNHPCALPDYRNHINTVSELAHSKLLQWIPVEMHTWIGFAAPSQVLQFRCHGSKGIQTGWKTLLLQNILQKLIITPVLSFKKERTGSRAEAQVLQVKGWFISLHYQGTGSCFQENAFHTVVLLKGVSPCLWQEFQAGTQALLLADMGVRSHNLI